MKTLPMKRSSRLRLTAGARRRKYVGGRDRLHICQRARRGGSRTREGETIIRRTSLKRAGRKGRLDGSGSAALQCGECEGPLRWEHTADHPDERWLAICACGIPWAFFPGRPGHRPEDPLAAALGRAQGSSGTSPPWIRLFQLTSGYPWWLPWRHVESGCTRCGQDVTFAVWTGLSSDRRAYSALCLACGQATSEYLRTANGHMREGPVTGNEWNPACVAVARLRRAVFSASPGWIDRC